MAKTETSFKKGESKGRPKGAVNRTTEEIRKGLLQILGDNLDNLRNDFQEMKGRERATLIVSLAKHCIPAFNPDNLTLDQIQQVIEHYKETEMRVAPQDLRIPKAG